MPSIYYEYIILSDTASATPLHWMKNAYSPDKSITEPVSQNATLTLHQDSDNVQYWSLVQGGSLQRSQTAAASHEDHYSSKRRQLKHSDDNFDLDRLLNAGLGERARRFQKLKGLQWEEPLMVISAVSRESLEVIENKEDINLGVPPVPLDLDPEQIVFETASQRVVPFASASEGSSSSSFSAVGLYIGIVYTIAKFIRLMFQDASKKIIYTELERTEFFEDICNGIYIARYQNDLQTEYVLYKQLIRLYRSPEMLLEYSAPRYSGGKA